MIGHCITVVIIYSYLERDNDNVLKFYLNKSSLLEKRAPSNERPTLKPRYSVSAGALIRGGAVILNILQYIWLQ